MDKALQARLEDDPLLERATEWFLELRSDSISGERVAEWQQWLAEDESNREAFERVESFWRLSDAATAKWPTESEVAADGYLGAESISAWRARAERSVGHPCEPRRARPRGRWGFSAALTAVGMAAAIGFLAFAYWPTLLVTLEGGSRVTVDTGIGETRTVTLPDGSIISAGGETSLVATLFDHSRTVVLSRGEAFFHVEKDQSRPFTVRAGSATVTDIGTSFDVRRTLRGVVIAVAEGVVQVSAPLTGERLNVSHRAADRNGNAELAMRRLTAGQRLTLEPFDVAPELSSINPTWAAGWREGRLQYVDEPLDGVVADLSRYSSRRIVINDRDVAHLRVTGVVFVQNIDGWLAGLEATFPVRVKTEGDGSAVIEHR